jgi:uncharacterized membrane protein YqgA involved in biofilm formation
VRILGTLINVGAVIAGSLAGMLVHAKLPERFVRAAFTGIGLFTLFVGFSMAAKTGNLIILVFAIVLGAITGELLHLEERLGRLGDRLKARLGSKNERFTEGLVAAFLLFCMGSMTVLGAIEEGTGARPNLLVAKSVLDGFASVALAASLGVGVLLSVVPLFLYQAGLTLGAWWLGASLSAAVISEVSAAGGLILIGLGIKILELRPLRVLNLLPALVYAGVLAAIFLR